MNKERNSGPQKSNYAPRAEHPAQQWLKNNTPDLLTFKKAENLKEILDHIQSFVKDKCGAVTTSQLRNIYAKIKNSKQTCQSMQLIRPKLAYIAARQASFEAKEIVDFFENIISKMDDDKQVPHFSAFMEAVVAYHKLYHTKK